MTRGLVIAASLLAVATHALYFHIAETERKCFIEEIPDETMVRSGFYFSLNSENYVSWLGFRYN